MSLKPTTGDQRNDDGPVKLTFMDGSTETWDRVHYATGVIKVYDVNRIDDTNRIEKGDRAKAYPLHRIKDLTYEGYKSEQDTT